MIFLETRSFIDRLFKHIHATDDDNARTTVESKRLKTDSDESPLKTSKRLKTDSKNESPLKPRSNCESGYIADAAIPPLELNSRARRGQFRPRHLSE